MRIAIALAALSAAPMPANAQHVRAALDPSEPVGRRPYEMVWANRKESHPPAITFSSLEGWRMEVSGGAAAELQLTRSQDVWDRPVARLRYRGEGSAASSPLISILPPRPIQSSDTAEAVTMWVYGNRWDWENPPGTPPVRIVAHLRGANGAQAQVLVDTVRWQEWWLLRRRIPETLLRPVTLERLDFLGGWQPEWREIYLDSLDFVEKSEAPLKFAARPRRNLTLPPGQSAGANTGPGRLPFPTREETILSPQLGGPFTNNLARAGGRYRFSYLGKDAEIAFEFDPAAGLPSLRASLGGQPVWSAMPGAGVRLEANAGAARLVKASQRNGKLTARYADGTTLSLQMRQKSLIVDISNATGKAAELTYGEFSEVRQPRAFYVPPMTYGEGHPSVLLAAAGPRNAFVSLHTDWYRSNGSELYGAEYAAGSVARINGGVRYRPKTDGRRNPLFERFFLTVSPRFEEVLPTIPNPVGLHAHQAVDRLWQESWGPDDYEKQQKRSRMLRAYGIEKLIQCNHEITWRDGGESFTLRTRAAPAKGGDEALARYVAHQRGLGWMSGLYTNYTDFAPVNEHWSWDLVQRNWDGEYRSAWPRCWALKPLAAVELDSRLAPIIKKKYNPNSAYTDVHTAVAPWHYCDYDARVPGAGTFAQTFYAYGELLRNDSRVYGGPIFSEGTYQWLYAGLADGNYGHTYNQRNLATEPLMPVFDLREIHTRECDIGVSWTSFFCDALPNWRAPTQLDQAIDRFLLTTLAYGRIGWLVEEDHGIERTCRSYYMLQQVQKRYGLKAPVRIAYWDGTRLVEPSEAISRNLPRDRRQMRIDYPGDLSLWINDHPSETWRIRMGESARELPPHGWAAYQPGTSGVLSFSGLEAGRRVDYLRSPDYTFLDGRGSWYEAPQGGCEKGIAIRPSGPNSLSVIAIGEPEMFLVRRPYGMRGAVARLAAYDVEGKPLHAPGYTDSGEATWVHCVPKAVRYEIAFTGSDTWSVRLENHEAAPGETIGVTTPGAKGAILEATDGQIRGGRLQVPTNLSPNNAIVVTALANGQKRSARIRIVPPLTWRLVSIEQAIEHTRVLLESQARTPKAPRMRLEAVTTGPFTAVVPAELPADGRVTAHISSSAPEGAAGEIRLTTPDVPGAPSITLACMRAKEIALAADLGNRPVVWGIAFRGKPETPAAAGTGALCHPDAAMSVGGVSRPGYFMHPPYTGGVGYTWAELGEVQLPDAPCHFSAYIGLRDGGDQSDGVLFRLQLVEDTGTIRTLAEAQGVQREWRAFRADLTQWKGRRVRLRIVADVGQADNSTADWACWAEPAIRLNEPRLITSIRLLP